MARETNARLSVPSLQMNETRSQNDAVKRFVRTHLGCSCPEAVFENIHRVDNSRFFPGADVVYAIGGRLLVAVFVPAQWRQVQDELEQLVNAGKTYRDQHGYNRLRLVIATNDSDAEEVLGSAFQALSNTDEKIHLHVTELQALPSNE
jgi:hypothetical protein